MAKRYFNPDYTYIDCEFDYDNHHYHLRACIDKDGNLVDDENNPKYSDDVSGADIYEGCNQYCIFFTFEDDCIQFELVFNTDLDEPDEPYNRYVGNDDTPFLSYINVWTGADCSNLEDFIDFDNIDSFIIR